MRAAIYLRVSKGEQHHENQLQPLEQFCKAKGLEITRYYAENESAWIAGHQAEWSRLVRDAANHHFNTVVVWSLDRITREGISAIFLKIKTLKQYGVNVLSVQESWLEALGDMSDLFIALLSWVANFESKRRSERTKAGLARARLHGAGKRGKDKQKRKTRVQKRPVIFVPAIYYENVDTVHT